MPARGSGSARCCPRSVLRFPTSRTSTSAASAWPPTGPRRGRHRGRRHGGGRATGSGGEGSDPDQAETETESMCTTARAAARGGPVTPPTRSPAWKRDRRGRRAGRGPAPPAGLPAPAPHRRERGRADDRTLPLAAAARAGPGAPLGRPDPGRRVEAPALAAAEHELPGPARLGAEVDDLGDAAPRRALGPRGGAMMARLRFTENLDLDLDEEAWRGTAATRC